MNSAQWYATLFAWVLTGMLTLLGFVRWAAIAAIIGVALVVSIAITGGIARAVRGWRRAGQVVEAAREDIAIAMTCDHCHGKPGRCQCTSRCGHPDCIGDHTTFSRRQVDELEEMLRRDAR